MIMINLRRRSLLALLGLSPAAALPSAAAARPRRDPVRLLFTRVNGEHYYAAAEAFPSLGVGDAVRLQREPTNAYDRRAIEVFDGEGRKLGYVARIDNSALARMMDAGEAFTARVARLGPGLDIRLIVDWLPG